MNKLTSDFRNQQHKHLNLNESSSSTPESPTTFGTLLSTALDPYSSQVQFRVSEAVSEYKGEGKSKHCAQVIGNKEPCASCIL